MAVFEAAYTDQRKTIVMKARLLHRYKQTKEKFIFDEFCFLPYKDETKFRCRLLVSTDLGELPALLQRLPNIGVNMHNVGTYCSDTKCDIQLSNGLLQVACPLSSQEFRRATSTKSGNYVAYFDDPDFRPIVQTGDEIAFALNTNTRLSNPRLRLQYWLSIHGPSSMFVKDRSEDFESKQIVSGGRPESNRRRS